MVLTSDEFSTKHLGNQPNHLDLASNWTWRSQIPHILDAVSSLSLRFAIAMIKLMEL